ncbi:MAG: hypothetical protein GC136_08155 [Alphaproteobacteria bacterium]|nr:hypothetical protein [Alphaproteobacteria bacterium]
MISAKRAFTAAAAFALGLTAPFSAESQAHNGPFAPAPFSMQNGDKVYIGNYTRERLGDLSPLLLGNRVRHEIAGGPVRLIVSSQRDIEFAIQEMIDAGAMAPMPMSDFFNRLEEHVTSGYREDPEIGILAAKAFDFFLENVGLPPEEFNEYYAKETIDNLTLEQTKVRTLHSLMHNRSTAYPWFDIVSISEAHLCLPYNNRAPVPFLTPRRNAFMGWNDVILEEVIHTRATNVYGPREEVLAAGYRYDVMADEFGGEAVNFIRTMMAEYTINMMNYHYYAYNDNNPSGLVFNSHPIAAFIDYNEGRIIVDPRFGDVALTDMIQLEAGLFPQAQYGIALANVSARDLMRNIHFALATHENGAAEQQALLRSPVEIRRYVASTILINSGAVTDPFALNMLQEYREAFAHLHGDMVARGDRMIEDFTQLLAGWQGGALETVEGEVPSLELVKTDVNHIPPLPTTALRQQQLMEEIQRIARTPGRAGRGVPSVYVSQSARACDGLGPQPN